MGLVRWLPNGHETFGGGLNCLVHVIMYGYYFLAALGPHMRPYLWWKKYLTTFQMIQFVCSFGNRRLCLSLAIQLDQCIIGLYVLWLICRVLRPRIQCCKSQEKSCCFGKESIMGQKSH